LPLDKRELFAAARTINGAIQVSGTIQVSGKIMAVGLN
jgi:hypothetical protein